MRRWHSHLPRVYLKGYSPARLSTATATSPVYDILRLLRLGGVVVRLSDSRLAVVGSNPGRGIAGFFSEVGDRFFG